MLLSSLNNAAWKWARINNLSINTNNLNDSQTYINIITTLKSKVVLHSSPFRVELLVVIKVKFKDLLSLESTTESVITYFVKAQLCIFVFVYEF